MMSEAPIWLAGAEPGKLAIVPRPRGGEWLPGEVRSWGRSGLEMVVSLLTPEEESELGLEGEAAQSRTLGLEFVAFPIPDRGVPPSRRDALQAGVPVKLALERISLARGREVPETEEQRRWVEDLAESTMTADRVSEPSLAARTPPGSSALPWTAHGKARRRR